MEGFGTFWMIAAVIALAGAVFFAVFFRDETEEPEVSGQKSEVSHS